MQCALDRALELRIYLTVVYSLPKGHHQLRYLAENSL